MRLFGWMILGALIGSGTASAQQPTNPGAPQDRNDRLGAVLWQLVQSFKGNQAVQVPDCTRIDKDPTGTKTWKGEVRFQKPNKFYLYLRQQEDQRFFECLVSNGSSLYEFRPQFKKLVVHEMPPDGFGTKSGDLLSKMFGTTIDFRRRFDVSLHKDVSAANPHYIYIDIKPQSDVDRHDFNRAELVISAKTMLPVRVWFERPNSSEVTWLLGNVVVNPNFNATAFAAPRVPDGWDVVQERLPRQPGTQDDSKPRIIRP
jgi:TIGR03009 family protein